MNSINNNLYNLLFLLIFWYKNKIKNHNKTPEYAQKYRIVLLLYAYLTKLKFLVWNLAAAETRAIFPKTQSWITASEGIALWESVAVPTANFSRRALHSNKGMNKST